MAYGIKERDYVGSYQQGLSYGAKRKERERRQPIVEQLEQLSLRGKEQALESGSRNITLKDLAIQEKERKRESEDMADIGKAAAYAGSQKDTPGAWDKVLDFYERQGKPVDHMRGRSDLIPIMIGLSNPSYEGQKAAQKELVAAIKSGDRGRILSAQVSTNPDAAVKSSLESPYEQARGDKLQGYSYNKQTGAYEMSDTLKGDLQKNVANALEFKDIRSLNTDVSKIIKAPSDIRSAAVALEGLKKTSTATDQLAAVFKLMKSLDPESVVREGEQAQARSTGGVADQFIGYINKIRGEGALPAEVMAQMVDTAKNLTNSAVTSAGGELTGYLDAYGEILSKDQYGLEMNRLVKAFDIKDKRNYTEGQTATGPNGEKIVFRGGKWKSI